MKKSESKDPGFQRLFIISYLLHYGLLAGTIQLLNIDGLDLFGQLWYFLLVLVFNRIQHGLQEA